MNKCYLLVGCALLVFASESLLAGKPDPDIEDCDLNLVPCKKAKVEEFSEEDGETEVNQSSWMAKVKIEEMNQAEAEQPKRDESVIYTEDIVREYLGPGSILKVIFKDKLSKAAVYEEEDEDPIILAELGRIIGW